MEHIVQANENSKSGGTGKNVGTFNRGDLVIITCDPQDMWNVSNGASGANCNALGLKDHNQKIGIQSFTIGSLVGSIDDGKSYFQVGTLLQMTITQQTAAIKLYCWDTNNDDNSGGISLNVMGYKTTPNE
jgi:hypothetical protein